MSFIDKIKKNDEQSSNISCTNKNKDTDLENLKPGWLLLKRDSNTGKTIIKRHPIDEHKERLNLIEKDKIEAKNTAEVFKRLTELYEKRTQEYIELYGYDTWEKIFKFPGWREWEEQFDDSDDDYSEDNEDQYNEENDLNEY